MKLDLVTEGKLCFQFTCVLGSVADCVNVNASARMTLNHALRDAQNVCALTKVGTVPKPNIRSMKTEIYAKLSWLKAS